ncbi:FAD-dependent monooxygenase [Streptomyces sp. SLBN-115]|uniref:FAD-dependent monooxygenase n=1 Tax=Streptomyces sp. SLBN-115 TaxID=2768453 RepID=UPI00114E1769|nr:FAD-dependent monooxygenase [Streptomyces sp. SLBN-115]TQJ46380.1 2-polyprenyl-6-methoxyphenol hydroxylase-like FAD-dependent oxidoreductase [Streptomyces sp. SLBN-115]
MTEIHDIDVDIDVLIAGAGPTGSTLAADLSRRGLRVRVVDKAPHAFEGSRAKGIQPRTQEVFEDLGVLNEALAEGGPYPLAGLHVGPVTAPWKMQQRSKPTPDVPYPNILLLPQHRTDAILHRLLDRLGLAVEYGVALEGFAHDAEGVTSTLSTGELVRSKYLVGADGGASAVRAATGLGFVGDTDDSDKTLIIDGTIDGLSRDRWHMWPRASAGACPLPHSDQFQLMIRLKPGDTPNLDHGALADRFHALTGLKLRDITWVSVFRPNVRLVEHYRQGRVFLAGDAAHVHTPAGAQGLNTGVQDAYNLGWKLAQAIAGAPDSLLDSYEAERLPIAAGVLGKSSELYQSLGKHSVAGLKRGDEERQLGLTYRGGPLAPADAPATETLHVGDRAPDAPCTAPGTRRLFDLYRGPHFTLLAFGLGATKALPDLTWPTEGAALRRYAVRSGRGIDGDRITDDTGRLTSIYGVAGDALILVRPDGYIGSIITTDWTASFATAAEAFIPK